MYISGKNVKNGLCNIFRDALITDIFVVYWMKLIESDQSSEYAVPIIAKLSKTFRLITTHRHLLIAMQFMLVHINLDMPFYPCIFVK